MLRRTLAVGCAIHAPVPKIGRLEPGRARLRLRDVASPCELYGASDHFDRVTLLSLPAWPTAPTGATPTATWYPAGFEPTSGRNPQPALSAATRPGFVPGPLQTPG